MCLIVSKSFECPSKSIEKFLTISLNGEMGAPIDIIEWRGNLRRERGMTCVRFDVEPF